MTNYTFKHRLLSEALYESLIPDPFYLMLERTAVGDSLQKKEALMRYLDYSIVEGEKYGRNFIPENGDYGVSVWSVAQTRQTVSEKKNEKHDFMLHFLGQNSLDYYLDVVGFMNQKTENLLPADSWYLSIVGLKPSHQNKGLGRTLIDPILVETDKLGLTTYLETFNSRNITFYQRLGFETVGNYMEPTVGSEYWILARQPK